MPRNVETSLGTFEIEVGNNSFRAKVTFIESCSNPDEINAFIKDLGKFETISKGINALTNSIGLTGIQTYNLIHSDFQEIGDFRPNMPRDVYEIFITTKEVELEEKRKSLTENDIELMIVNIEKYYSLKDSFEMWNPIFTTLFASH